MASGKYLKFGLAKIDITPPLGSILTDLDSGRKAAGVHKPLFAKAVMLEQGREKAVLISCDLLGLSAGFVNAARRKIEERTGVSAGKIMICATHTHSGPSSIYLKGPGLDKKYLVFLEKKLIELAEKSKKDLRPGGILIGRGKSWVGINRRLKSGREILLLEGDQAKRRGLGALDPEVGVISFVDQQKKIRGIIVNYSCHAVVLAKEKKISPDYPGILTEMIEKSLPGNAIALFTNGAAGNINPCFSCTDSFNDLEAISYELCREVLRIIKRSQFESDPDIKIGRKKIRLGHHINFEIQVFKMGNIVLVGFPAEVFTEIGLTIKKKSPYPYTYFIGYANGCYGYLPTAKAIKEGGYEVKAAAEFYQIPPFGKKAANTSIREALSLIQSLKR